MTDDDCKCWLIVAGCVPLCAFGVWCWWVILR
jgi:hypothetical protein